MKHICLLPAYLLCAAQVILSQNTPAHFNDYFKRDNSWYKLHRGFECKVLITRIVVQSKNDVSRDGIQNSIPSSLNVKRFSGPLWGGYYCLTFDSEAESINAFQSLRNSDSFNFVDFDVAGQADMVPNDLYYVEYCNGRRQWNLDTISRLSAWSCTTGDSSVIVAVIGTGVDYSGNDLSLSMKRNEYDTLDGVDNDNNGLVDDYMGWDFYENDNIVDDDGLYRGHETQVAGIIASRSNNGTGVAGIAGGWGDRRGVSVLPVKVNVFDDRNRNISAASIAEGLRYSVNMGATVVNMSFSFAYPYVTLIPYLSGAIDTAVNIYGVTIIASTGNDDTSHVYYPASDSNAIAVGAIDSTNIRWRTSQFGSNYGPEIDIVAPTIVVTPCKSGQGYGGYDYEFAGTSAAAPHVSGVVALMASINRGLTPLQIRNTIIRSADKIPAMGDSLFTWEYGYGRVNAYKAVRNIYVPAVQPIIDSGFAVIRNGQAIVLEPQSGSHTITSIEVLPANTTLEIHAGDTLVVQDSLVIDTSAVVWLYSDPGSPAVIRCVDTGVVILNHPLALRGSGVIIDANLRWRNDFQLTATDSLTFADGGLLA